MLSDSIGQISTTARRAAQVRDWSKVRACAREILKLRKDSAEGLFLLGLADKVENRPEAAIKSFSKAVGADGRRYDAAVELAELHVRSHQYGAAAALLRQHASSMGNSPKYLDMAGTIYTRIGLPERAWPLHKKANELQPGVDSLRANLAACSVFVGRIDDARDVYRQLLEKSPNHQRNHYELSRLGPARDTSHIDQMKALLQASAQTPDRNIYLFYAIGKELEDLEHWDEAFRYYKMAGDAVARSSSYDVESDTRLIDAIINVCDAEWMAQPAPDLSSEDSTASPIFVVGLPRSGTTLTERILSSHSQVETVGETYLLQLAIQDASGVGGDEGMNPAIVEAAASKNIGEIARNYIDAVAYKRGHRPMFVEKFPENFLYLGFIAKAFPQAPIVYLNRNPMDNCFALYKQSFFRYAYSLDDLGRFYVAYNQLQQHWRAVLGDRLIELDYEELVSDQESRTRALLDGIGLEFEESCLAFERNAAASNTASTVQVREKIHQRSVNRWKRFESHLQPLRRHLEEAGIEVESSG